MNVNLSKEEIKHFLEEVWSWITFIFQILVLISAVVFVIYDSSKPCDEECMEDAKDSYENSYRL